jgi:hypothetical protein
MCIYFMVELLKRVWLGGWRHTGGGAAPPPVTSGGGRPPLAFILIFFFKKSFIYFLIKQSIYNKLLFHTTFHNINHYTQLFKLPIIYYH